MPPGGLASNSSASATSTASTISAAVMNTTNGFVATAPSQVVVAPKMGDLRMVPFAINIDAGQSAQFFWGAGPHTVTQSSALEVCNKTKTPTAFVSGLKNATSTFSEPRTSVYSAAGWRLTGLGNCRTAVPVNNTDTIWYYCSVPTHCQKVRRHDAISEQAPR